MYEVLLVPILSGLCLTAHAQTSTIVRYRYNVTEASSATGYPFGITSPARCQYLYESSLVHPMVVSVNEIGLRGNGGFASSSKTGVELEIRVSATKADPWAASPVFATNHGANVTTVFTRKKIDLPTQGTKTPQDFLTVFELDKSFVYIRSNGNLLIDYIVHGQPEGISDLDTSHTSKAAITNDGSGCGIAVHLLGSKELASPVTLPLGGCKLCQDILLAIGSATNASGGTTLTHRLTSNARDQVIYGQFVAFDSKLTRLVASPSNKTVIGCRDPHTRIYDVTSATSATGTVQPGVGIVTRLR